MMSFPPDVQWGCIPHTGGKKKKKEHQYLLVLIYVSLKISEKRRAATQSNTEKMWIAESQYIKLSPTCLLLSWHSSTRKKLMNKPACLQFVYCVHFWVPKPDRDAEQLCVISPLQGNCCVVVGLSWRGVCLYPKAEWHILQADQHPCSALSLPHPLPPFPSIKPTSLVFSLGFFYPYQRPGTNNFTSCLS